MKILGIRTIQGPNIYSYQPVLVMQLHLEELTDKETYELPGFNERLLALLPGLAQHHCSKGYAGGFLERLSEGTYFGHTVEHIALELTELAGIPTFHGKTRTTGKPGIYNVVVEYQAEKGTEKLLRMAVALVEALLKNEPFPLEAELDAVRLLVARTELGPSTRAVVEAAVRRGIPWQRLNEESLVQLGYGKYRRLIAAAITSDTSAIGVDLASDKDLTKRLLHQAGIPVPQGEIVATEEEAVRVLEWLHKPVAVKPYDGQQGKGVSLNLYTAEQVAEGFRVAREFAEDVLVEELFIGRDYRVLVVGGRLVAASERLPAHIVGDGKHTLAELIEVENRNPLRGEGHGFPLTKIEIDEVCLAHLQKNKLSLASVPSAGERVFLRENANLSKGGTARDVTAEVHPQVRQICERAALVVGLDVCGVDLVLPNIAEPIPKGSAGIIEVNAAPGLRMHVHPSEGEPRDVGNAIIESLYPSNSSGRIPIFSVTGTNGKTTIARLIAHLMRTTGQCVGLTTTDGIYLNDELIVAGDTTGPRSAQVILSDPSVEIAVLEVARGGIMRGGLAYDWSDVSILSNIQPDHLGQDGINNVDDLLYIKSLVAERVKEGGTLILNADDERLAGLTDNPRVQRVPKQIVFYSLDAAHPLLHQHVAAGGTAYCVREGWLVESVGNQETRIVAVAEIPLTLGGAASYQTSNVLAAVAAARAYGLPHRQIANALIAFGAHGSAGRGNLYRVGAGQVFVDYGHNPQAFAVVGQALKSLNPTRVTAVIGVPGDRNDEVIRQAAEVAAKHYDRLIIKEDKDRRGRRAGEVPELFSQAAEEARPGIESRIVLDEVEAVSLALRELQPGEIVAVFYEKPEDVNNVLERNGAVPTQWEPAQGEPAQGEPAMMEALKS
ncbi:MAG TPA: cyanophycin synthetase [Blastocatellia bacterium]|nr:cyanophycin synthetase [Blastocatellia bacterium]